MGAKCFFHSFFPDHFLFLFKYVFCGVFSLFRYWAFIYFPLFFFPFSQHFFIVTIVIINFSFCFCFVMGYSGRLIYLTILKKEGKAIYLRLFICFLISSPSTWLNCLTDSSSSSSYDSTPRPNLSLWRGRETKRWKARRREGINFS